MASRSRYSWYASLLPSLAYNCALDSRGGPRVLDIAPSALLGELSQWVGDHAPRDAKVGLWSMPLFIWVFVLAQLSVVYAVVKARSKTGSGAMFKRYARQDARARAPPS